jgi:hypothetical protein
LKLAVTSTGLQVVKEQFKEDLGLTSYDHRRLTKQIVANEKLFDPKRIYSEGINLNKTLYKGKCHSNFLSFRVNCTGSCK